MCNVRRTNIKHELRKCVDKSKNQLKDIINLNDGGLHLQFYGEVKE